jgi:hypothetical protein
LKAVQAALILTMPTNAGVPSCIRVPPEAGAAKSGSSSSRARSKAATIRAAAVLPMDPARNRNSPAMTATRRPLMRPSPVTIDSSAPERSPAAANSSA